MDGTYEILLGSEPVGTVTVYRQGLYYFFSARCRLSGEGVCRLRLTCGEAQENLGVLVPVEGMFGLDKKLPVRRFGTEIPQFQVLTNHRKTGEKFVPIYPEEPFAYMTRLKDAFLATRDGQVGIVLKNDSNA